MARPAISVVVIAHNANAALSQTLEGLALQTLDRAQYEVVVVDDGSTEPVDPVASRFQDSLTLRHIRVEQNEGRAAARNRGFAHTGADRVLFLDGDMICDPGLLEAHLATGGADRVVMGYRLNLLHDRGQEAIARQQMTADSREPLFARHSYDLSSWIMPWQALHAHNFSLTRTSFERAGGFDVQFRHWGVEDAEFGYRLHRCGLPFVFARHALAYHIPHPRDRRAERESNLINTQLFVMKHRTVDAELFHALFIESRYYDVQCAVLQSLAAAARQAPTWQEHIAGIDLPRPMIVLCAGEHARSQGRDCLAHPSLLRREDPLSLLGMWLPYADRPFASMLLSRACLELADLLPGLLREAFRVAREVFLEAPGGIPPAAAAVVGTAGMAMQPVGADGAVFKLRT
jgi:glycosyltransferase involved in cell wall biosynthesis